MKKTSVQQIFQKLTFADAWNSFLDDINNDVLLSGKPLDTLILIGHMRTAIIITCIVIFPLSLYLASLVSPVFIGLNLLWILIFVMPKMQQQNLAQTRKKNVEEELPFFILIASIMQNVGVGLYNSFQIFREANMFPALGKEALLLKRNMEFFGLSQMEALEELGRTHKSELFKNALLGYTSIWRSGGDLSLYLESRTEDLFTDLKDRYQLYTNNVATVIEVLVTLLVILPIMIMVASFVLPGSSLEQMTILATIALPLFSIMLAVFISSIQPKGFNTLGLTDLVLAIAAGIGLVSAISVYLLSGELWMTLLIGIVAPCSISAVIVGRQYYEMTKLEDSLPQFLRDITEYKKIGYDLILAINNLSQENLYNKIFNKKIQEWNTYLQNGLLPVASIKNLETRSWFTKISFYLLAYVAEYGGGNPKTLETISRFIINARHTVKEGKSSVSALTMIIFAAPLIMAFTAGMILGILGDIDTSVFDTSQSGVGGGSPGFSQGFINLVAINDQFISLIKVLIVTSSLMGAVVITKAIDFTFYNMWRIVVIGGISLGATYLVDFFTDVQLDFNSILSGLPV